MKYIIALSFLIASGAMTALAQYGTMQPSLGGTYGYGTGSNPNSHTVNPYQTQSGTYVGGHHQTNPNNTQLDNYSTRGNVNPYTGQMGTRAPRW
jgi:hypothetical protein